MSEMIHLRLEMAITSYMTIQFILQRSSYSSSSNTLIFILPKLENW